MAEFMIWARITQTGPRQFVVIASSVRGPGESMSGGEVMTETLESRSKAEAARDRLTIKMGEKVIARGDRVVDVVVE